MASAWLHEHVQKNTIDLFHTLWAGVHCSWASPYVMYPHRLNGNWVVCDAHIRTLGGFKGSLCLQLDCLTSLTGNCRWSDSITHTQAHTGCLAIFVTLEVLHKHTPHIHTHTHTHTHTYPPTHMYTHPHPPTPTHTHTFSCTHMRVLMHRY